MNFIFNVIQITLLILPVRRHTSRVLYVQFRDDSFTCAYCAGRRSPERTGTSLCMTGLSHKGAHRTRSPASPASISSFWWSSATVFLIYYIFKLCFIYCTAHIITVLHCIVPVFKHHSSEFSYCFTFFLISTALSTPWVK